MGDTSKKKPRKSKLVPREYCDIENTDSISQQELQQSTLSILPETSNSLTKLISTLDEEPIYRDAPAVNISIEVQVESCEEENIEEENVKEITKSVLQKQHIAEFYIPKEVLLQKYEEVFNSRKADNPIDKRLKGEILNYLGRFPCLKHPLDKYEDGIQNALIEWRNWGSQAFKVRTYIFIFKCQVCSLGFWHLHDFREHIQRHEDLKIQFYCHSHEGCITAVSGAWFENICEIQVEGDCPRCLKSYPKHSESKNGTMFYHCVGCKERFATCALLFDHEGFCQKFERIHFANQMVTDQLFRCDVCDTFCLEQSRYDKHIIGMHSPRSDLPVPLPSLKTCQTCGGKYVMTCSHHCRAKIDAAKCTFCYRRFQNNVLYKAHELGSMKSSTCVKCDKLLKRRCMEVEHYLKHSKNYFMGYKCTECKDFVLTINGNDLLKHKLRWHKSARRRNVLDPIILPKSILELAEPPSLELLVSLSYEIDALNEEKPTEKDPPKKRRRSRKIKVSQDIHNEPSDADDVEIIQEPVTRIEISDDDEQMKVDNDNSQSSINFNIKKEKDGFDEPPVDLEIKIKTEIKNEEDDETQINYDDNLEDMEKENDEYLKQLSKVFRASKDIQGSLIAAVHEEYIIKEEDGDEYEDDIIMLDATKVDERLEIKAEQEISDDKNIYEAPPDVKVNNSTILEDDKTKQTLNDTSISVEVNVSNVNTDFNVFISDIDKTNSKNEDLETTNENHGFTNNNDANIEIKIEKSEPTPCSSTQEDNKKTIDFKKIPKLYECSKCGYNAEYSSFIDHAVNICKVRSKSYSLKKSIYIFNSENYICTKCIGVFSTFDEYVQHFEDHGLRNRCPQCLIECDDVCSHITGHIKASFMKIQELKRTKVTSSKSTGLYQCRECSQQLKVVDFFSHWESHLQIKCNVKQEKTENVKYEDKQSQKCMQDQIKNLITQLTHVEKETCYRQCVQCHHQFERRNDCKRHVIEHLLEHAYVYRTDNKMRGIRCQVCGELFYRNLNLGPDGAKETNMNEKDQYRLHMRNHGGLPVYKCQLCNKSFSDSSNFAKHKKVHNVQVKAICDHCGKKFQSKIGLIRHIKIHDTDTVPKCETCQRVYKCPTTLRKHIRMNHEKVVRYTCSFCKMKHPSLKQLWDHMWLVHQESKIIADCPYCFRSYRRIIDLKKHVKAVHGMNSTASLETVGDYLDAEHRKRVIVMKKET